jgi:hypothetical protein
MAVLHYAYLRIKLHAPRGGITIFGCYKFLSECVKLAPSWSRHSSSPRRSARSRTTWIHLLEEARDRRCFTLFFLVYGADAVLPADIEHESPRVIQYTVLLEEAWEMNLPTSAIYQQSLRWYHSCGSALLNSVRVISCSGWSRKWRACTSYLPFGRCRNYALEAIINKVIIIIHVQNNVYTPC